MTMVFIWNDSLIKSKLHSIGLKQKDSEKHGVIGHAAVNIDENWVEPFTQDVDINALIEANEEIRDLDPPEVDYSSFIELPLDEMYQAMADADNDKAEFLRQKLAAKEAVDNAFIDNRDSYVSWWPGEGSSHRARSSGDGNYRAGAGHRNFWIDLLDEGYAPDHIIQIPASQNAILRMKEKWTEEQTKNNGQSTYRLYRKNCSRMAARILHKGFKSKYKHGYGVKRAFVSIWSPVEVKRMAMNIKGAREVSWSDFVDLIWPQAFFARLNQKASLLEFTKRASNRGSSDAQSRFVFDNKGRLVGAPKPKNTMSFLTPPLTIENANDLTAERFEVGAIRRAIGQNEDEPDPTPQED